MRSALPETPISTPPSSAPTLINKSGGLLGRPVQLFVEDTASNEAVAVANVRRLIERDHVDVVLGGITSSMRNAIKGPIVQRGHTLYIYPTLYEGKECENLIYCTGPTPSQQCDRLIPWLIKNSGKRFAFPSANYIWPHVLNKYARNLVESGGGEVIFEEYYPIAQLDYGAAVNRIMTERIDVVFVTVIPPGVGPFFKQLYEAGFLKRGGRLCCVYTTRLPQPSMRRRKSRGSRVASIITGPSTRSTPAAPKSMPNTMPCSPGQSICLGPAARLPACIAG